MQNSDKPTRRQAIVIGVAAASAVVGASVAGSAATTAASARDWAATGRVRSVSGGLADLDLLAGVAGRAAAQVVGRASMPIVGFPAALVLRAGDRVAISTTTPGYEAAAMPLCHWVKGVPQAVSDGSFLVAGERVVGGLDLAAAAQGGQAVKVRLLDTDLATAQVLSVRADQS
jgi:hypothetical protein